jgi:hypothetical protein
LGIGHGVRIVGLAEAGDERGVVGGRRDRALLERRQQLLGSGRMWLLARALGNFSRRVVDVVGFRSSDPLDGA